MTEREGLIARRAALQARLTQEAQLDAIRDVVEALDAAGTPYAVVWPEPGRPAGAALLRRWPLSGVEVAWGEVPQAAGCEVGDDAGRNAALRDVMDRLADPEEPVTALWSNGAKPGLVLRAGDAVDHAADLLDAALEVWLCGANGRWLIEFRHDTRRLAWADASA